MCNWHFKAWICIVVLYLDGHEIKIMVDREVQFLFVLDILDPYF
jgi:hypothetical protein